MMPETLDMILTIAAFDQFVRLLFIDDGVLFLCDAPESTSARDADARALLQALNLYDVHEVLVGRESLLNRGLAEGDSRITATVVPEATIRGLLAEHARIWVC